MRSRGLQYYRTRLLVGPLPSPGVFHVFARLSLLPIVLSPELTHAMGESFSEPRLKRLSGMECQHSASNSDPFQTVTNCHRLTTAII